jgi:hypothetical protein
MKRFLGAGCQRRIDMGCGYPANRPRCRGPPDCWDNSEESTSKQLIWHCRGAPKQEQDSTRLDLGASLAAARRRPSRAFGSTPFGG